MREEHKPRDYKKLLVLVSLLAGATIIIMGFVIHNLNKDYASVSDYYSKNYQINCPTGTKNVCIDTDKEYTQCDKLTSYPTCVDKGKYSSQCDADGYSLCVKKDQPYTICNSNQYALCVDKGVSYNSCSLGSQAICLDSSKWAVWDGNYAYSCSAGKTASCNY